MFNGFSLALKQNGIHGLAKKLAPVHGLIRTDQDFRKYSKQHAQGGQQTLKYVAVFSGFC